MLPNFLVCGVQKAATTSLHAYLRQHPQIYLPETKGLNYFNQHWDKPLAWYEAHFAGCSGQPAVGEVSPLYLWDEHAPERIARTLPEARLIFLLRNPIDRAYSNYWFNVARGAQNPNEGFSAAIRSSEGEWRYLSKGLYAAQLSRYVAHFPRTRLLILYTEDLQASPQPALRRICGFLGVDADIEVDVARRHNATLTPRNRLASVLWTRWLAHRERVRRLVPTGVAAWSRKARRGLHGLLFRERAPAPMSAADRDYLRAWFAADVAELTRMLGESPPWSRDFRRFDGG